MCNFRRPGGTTTTRFSWTTPRRRIKPSSRGETISTSFETARRLAQKQSARLRKLDPLVARRRLAGMLQRRGFDYDTIKPVIDEVLGDD